MRAGGAPNLDDFGGNRDEKSIILMMSVSLDGFIEGPDRELDWHMVDDELHSHCCIGREGVASGRLAP